MPFCAVVIAAITVVELLALKSFAWITSAGLLPLWMEPSLTPKSYQKMSPCLTFLSSISQADRWSITDKQIYKQIKESADKVVYTAREYTTGCMHKRNRHLVDNSSVCVCYLTENTGGTAYTVNYATSQGLSIINTA